MLFSPTFSAFLLALSVNATPTSLVKRAVVSGKIPATWTSRTHWITTLRIGGQQVNMTLDTGSGDFWVISGADPNHPASGYYVQPSPSVAPVLPYATWNISYIDGSGASGNTVVTDTITSPSSSLSIPGQSIQLANSNTTQQSDSSVGVLGLRFHHSLLGNSIGNTVKNSSTGVKIPQTTPWETSQLGFFTTNLPVSNIDAFVGFGIDDTSKYSGALTYAPIDQTSVNWMVNATSSKVGSAVVPHTIKPTLLDTGTGYTYLDAATVAGIYSHLSGGGLYNTSIGWQFNCTAPLPQISLGIGSSFSDLNMSKFSFKTYSDGYCKGIIQQSADTDTHAIYGTIVFRSAYFKWDGANARVGFAPYV